MLGSELRARRSLRIDALYCAAAGVLAVGLSPVLARLLDVPVPLLAAIGLAAVGWAWLLLRLARRRAWLQPLRAVAAANAIASLGLAVLAALAPALAGRLLLAAVAVEVAAFAVVQARLAISAHGE